MCYLVVVLHLFWHAVCDDSPTSLCGIPSTNSLFLITRSVSFPFKQTVKIVQSYQPMQMMQVFSLFLFGSRCNKTRSHIETSIHPNKTIHIRKLSTRKQIITQKRNFAFYLEYHEIRLIHIKKYDWNHQQVLQFSELFLSENMLTLKIYVRA